MFAEKAEQEGYHMISRLFNAISSAETIHIKNHLKALEKITNSLVKMEDISQIDLAIIKNNIGNTRENLIQAIAGEIFEFKNMYKSYIKKAKQENFYLAEFSFDLARKAEKVHSKLFIKYLKKLDKQTKFEEIDIFVCQICGNVELGIPPNTCPVCDHNVQFFEKYIE